MAGVGAQVCPQAMANLSLGQSANWDGRSREHETKVAILTAKQMPRWSRVSDAIAPVPDRTGADGRGSQHEPRPHGSNMQAANAGAECAGARPPQRATS